MSVRFSGLVGCAALLLTKGVIASEGYQGDEINLDDLLVVPTQPEMKGKFAADLMSLREAAESYGAKGGRIYQLRRIHEKLDRMQAEYDYLYNFENLSLVAPSGFLVVPPVVSMVEGTVSVTEEGQAASYALMEYQIVSPARITGVAPDWRTYLYEPIEKLSPPDFASLPQNKAQMAVWEKHVRMGWVNGIRQANLSFELNHSRLIRDFEGIALFKQLVMEKKVHEIHVAVVDKSTVIEGNSMRVGDRAIRIVQNGAFNPATDHWKPIVIYREPAEATRRSR